MQHLLRFLTPCVKCPEDYSLMCAVFSATMSAIAMLLNVVT